MGIAADPGMCQQRVGYTSVKFMPLHRPSEHETANEKKNNLIAKGGKNVFRGRHAQQDRQGHTEQCSGWNRDRFRNPINDYERRDARKSVGFRREIGKRCQPNNKGDRRSQKITRAASPIVESPCLAEGSII